MAVGELLLILGLLVSAHCEVRARDPEVEQEEEERGTGSLDQQAQTGAFGALIPPNHRHLPHVHRPEAQGGQKRQENPVERHNTVAPPLGDGGNYPARTGNWCAFVHRREVTMAVACGTEKYNIKSQSPCPNGTPNCQLVMYKLSTRPVYRQKVRVFTALLWRCCPGHAGENCEDIVPGSQVSDSANSSLIGRYEQKGSKLHPSGLQYQRSDLDQEQNDHYASISLPNDSTHNNHSQTDSAHRQHLPPHGPAHPHEPPPRSEDLHGLQYQRSDLDQEQNDHYASISLPNDSTHNNHSQTDSAHRQHLPPHGPAHPHEPPPRSEDLHGVEGGRMSALPLPDMMALFMSHLQPLLDHFNGTLQQLSRQVEELSRDVAQLRSEEQEDEEKELLEGRVQERIDAKLGKRFPVVKDELHSQHAMLHYNLTSFRTEVDMKLKQSQELLQVSLQVVNASLSEMRLTQEQLNEELQKRREEENVPHPSSPLLPPNNPAVWVVMERLDSMVVNNTVKVSGLLEDLKTNSENMEELSQGFGALREQIVQTGRNSQIQFMETGLEVEAAKEAVLSQVGELAGNLSQQSQRLQELDVDVDYLYTALYKTSNSSGQCNCNAQKAQISWLEEAVANVTQLAHDNHLEVHGANEAAAAGRLGEVGDWEPLVETLQLGLQQVKESLVFEQARSRLLDHSLTRLNGSLAGSMEDLLSLQEDNLRLREEMRHLSSSFASLLKDAVRHSEVLEVLLGEEVLEFMEWLPSEQEAHSVPVLKEQIRHLQQQLSQHSHSIAKLLGDGGSNHGEREEEAADQPSSSRLSDWLSSSLMRSGGPARQHQLLQPEGRGVATRYADGGHLWSLEKTVEELRVKVHRLEEQPCCNSSSREEVALQAEVQRLRRGVEGHLRLFKSIFSNAEHLERADATLDLQQLWALLRKEEGRREKRRKGATEAPRSKRNTDGRPGGAKDILLLLLASLHSVQPEGLLLFEASVNRERVYTETGTFTAPADGVYLFLLSLDLRLGRAHVVMKRRKEEGSSLLLQEEVMAAGPVTGWCLLLLRKGEEVAIWLSEGGLTPSQNNILAMLLLHHTT
ncbi:multimerin-2-like isoform X4 [Lampris incognitus]|uniref:multimerin-2-like isoform X4 n=1 Tax=Lampris incognitus TaxID=2546036 RepID=UPI0024B50590|nr:multimerin-2-like isoform X4 [Lampris incognitus]